MVFGCIKRYRDFTLLTEGGREEGGRGKGGQREGGREDEEIFIVDCCSKNKLRHENLHNIFTVNAITEITWTTLSIKSPPYKKPLCSMITFIHDLLASLLPSGQYSSLSPGRLYPDEEFPRWGGGDQTRSQRGPYRRLRGKEAWSGKCGVR